MPLSEYRTTKAGLLNALVALASLVWGASTLLASSVDSFSSVPSAMAILSLLFFLALCLVGSINQKLYWSIVPVLMLFAPNAVNDLFPGMVMSADPGAPVFSFFTHVDILFLIGVVRYCDFSKRLSGPAIWLGLFVFLLCATVLFGALLNDNFWRVVLGGYQVRYYLWLCLLFCFADPVAYKKEISTSIIFSLVLVLFESIIFTLMSGAERLTSGNYGVNSLGHLFAVAAVVLLSRSFTRLRRVVSYAVAAVFCIAVVATGTRFSLLVIFGCYASLIFIRRARFIYLPVSIILLAIFVLMFVKFTPAGASLLEGVMLVSESYTDPSGITVTPESSSMVTRLTLWLATLKMVELNPWFGVGPGSWAFNKLTYHIPYAEVLDPHQDLLSYVSSYGVIFGLGFYVVVFMVPLFKAFSRKHRVPDSWFWLAILVSLILAGLSNAVTWKHQIAALAYLSSLMFIFIVEKERA